MGEEKFLERKHIDTEAGQIYYFINNRHSGRPTVVFLHGLTANHTTWSMAARRLDEIGYNSILLEMRGHGLSAQRRLKRLYKLALFADDLNGIIKQEKIEDFILVGYSFSGAVVLEYLDRYKPRVRSLILISTNHVNPLIYRNISFITPLGRLAVNILAYLFWWEKRKNYEYYHPTKYDSYWKSTMHGFNTMPWSVNLWMLEQTVTYDYRETVKRIKAPTLIIYTPTDAFVTKREVEDMAAAMKNAEIAVSKNRSHYIASEAQEEVAEFIINFIKKYENRNL